MADDDMIIEIPSDTIEMGHDADGLPKTVPSNRKVAREEAPEPRAREASRSSPQEEEAAELEAARNRMREAQQRISQMERDMAAERDARRRAETGALDDRTFAWRTHMAKLNADHEQMKGWHAAANAAREQARRELRVAKEAGDGDAEAAALERITVATTQMQEFERGRAGVEAEIARNREPYEQFEAALHATRHRRGEPDTAKKEEPRQLSPDEWVDTQAPNSIRGWLKEHRDFMPGGKNIRQLNRFVDEWLETHNDDRGTLDTKAFARALDDKFFPSDEEREIEMADDERRVKVEETPAKRTTSKTAPAAPVSRGNGYYSSRNPNASKVRLPPDLAAFVRSTGLNPTKYVEGVLEDIRKGDKPKEWLDPDYDRGIT